AYDRVPYFFTDQYDLGMEYSGYVDPGGYDQVVFRGDVPRREFLAFWVGGGRVLAGMNVNIWDVNDKIAALVRAGLPVDPARLADPDVPLEALAVYPGGRPPDPRAPPPPAHLPCPLHAPSTGRPPAGRPCRHSFAGGQRGQPGLRWR